MMAAAAQSLSDYSPTQVAPSLDLEEVRQNVEQMR